MQRILCIRSTGFLIGKWINNLMLLKWYAHLFILLCFSPCSSAYSAFELFQVPIVMCPEDGCFPGLYCSSILSNPWLSDGCTMILTSAWRSTEVILSINVLSGKVTRITPEDSHYSWSALAIDGDNVLAGNCSCKLVLNSCS